MTQKQRPKHPLFKAAETDATAKGRALSRPNVSATLEKISNAEAKTKTVRKKRKKTITKTRYICCCGVPECTIGPFDQPYTETYEIEVEDDGE